MRVTIKKSVLTAVLLLIGVMLVKMYNRANPGHLRALNVLGVLDENGQLTEGFSDELALKNGLLKRGINPQKNLVDDDDESTVHPEDGDLGIDPISYYRGEDLPDDVLAMNRPKLLPNYKNPCWHERLKDKPETKVLRCLPYVHLIGVDKSGTTDLWHRMTKHPDFLQPEKAVMGKETHWWSWRRFGFDIWVKDKPIRHFDWYLSHFDEAAKKIEQVVVRRRNTTFHPLITGEGSPTVFWDFTGWDRIPQNTGLSPENANLTPRCIKHLTPDAKFIVIFRDPTERLYSDYLFLDRFRSYHNVSAKGFHQGVLRSIEMLNNCFAKKSQTQCLYDKQLHMDIPVRIIVGMYDIFLEQWLKVFSPHQILVLSNEHYSRYVKGNLQAVFSFLGLRPLSENVLEEITKLPRVFEKNKQMKKLGPMLNETRIILNKFYSKFNERLSARLQDAQFLWKSSKR